jgi:hypothetical protein
LSTYRSRGRHGKRLQIPTLRWHLVQEFRGIKRLYSIFILFGSKGVEQSGSAKENILPICGAFVLKKHPNPPTRVSRVASVFFPLADAARCPEHRPAPPDTPSTSSAPSAPPAYVTPGLPPTITARSSAHARALPHPRSRLRPRLRRKLGLPAAPSPPRAPAPPDATRRHPEGRSVGALVALAAAFVRRRQVA